MPRTECTEVSRTECTGVKDRAHKELAHRTEASDVSTIKNERAYGSHLFSGDSMVAVCTVW